MAIVPAPRPAAQLVVVAARTRSFLASEPAPLSHVLEGETTAEGQEAGHTFSRPRGVTTEGERTIVCHLLVSKWTGIQIQRKTFDLDHAFGPEHTNEDVYRALFNERKVLETVFDGGTHTIQGLEHNIATDLFAAAAIFAHAHFPSVASLPEDVFKVEIEAIEILGKESWDLLERDEGQERGRKVEIAENRHGSIEISTSRHRASSSKELLALVDRAAAARQTRSTIKNDVSSRSHALTTVLVTNTLFPTATPGRLFIVDLAGSERAADRAGNERDRLEEGRLINESLMTLKNCVRARSMVDLERARNAFVHVPYRGSKLTLALKPVFDLESTQTCQMIVIGHASPHPQDAAHSQNTLNYCAPFRVVPTKLVDEAADQRPSLWSNEQFKAWVARESKKVDPNRLAPNGETGLVMSSLSEKDFVARCMGAARPGTKLTPAAAKAFYLHLWQATVDSKAKSQPYVLHGRLVARDPSTWTHHELLDFFEQEFAAIDGERAFPEPLRGKDVMGMGEATFLSRVLQSPRQDGKPVTEGLARKARDRLWSLKIEERTAGRDVMRERKPPGLL